MKRQESPVIADDGDARPGGAGEARTGSEAAVPGAADARATTARHQGTGRGVTLCLMRIPPDPDGHGGSQRAWFLLRALAHRGPVHFVLLHRAKDRDAAKTSLDPVRRIAESVTAVDIPEWQPVARRRIGPLDARWLDVARMGSQEAPRISRAGIARIAASLPVRSVQTVFAGRLPTAVLTQALLDGGHLTASRRFADLDDLMSRLRERQLRLEGPSIGHQGRALLRWDIRSIAAAERRITESWDGVSTSATEDRDILRAWCPGAAVTVVPNVMHRDLLPPRAGVGPVRLLFVGNLGYAPNTGGLRAFIREAWPTIRRALPTISLDVVGMDPAPDLRDLAALEGFALHADVPSVRPFYETADVVIVPILFGSGTRIKILEAMAYGRPVVTTAAGAEGLGLEDGRHAMIVPDMAAFADAVIRLARDGASVRRLREEARAFQLRTYGWDAMRDTLDEGLAA